MNELTLRVVLTGATGGIGTAIARRLARRGVRLALVGSSLEKVTTLARELEAASPSLSLAGDLALSDTPQRLIREAAQHMGGIDVLINNAGVAHSAAWNDTTVDAFDRCMAINARAPFLLAQAARPYLLESKRAAIVNIASVAAHTGYKNELAYAASKHALLGISKVLATELQPHDVRVHVISTGGVASPMLTNLHPDADLSAFMDPDDVARAVEFVLDSRSNAVIDEIRIRRRTSSPVW
ncbi:MAG: short-chain dehydrogenase/reductase [Deltaproteobacteria bacterium]|nr:short-chain dehydrogenase/reductase [Deltaproteobacteria bacterium]